MKKKTGKEQYWYRCSNRMMITYFALAFEHNENVKFHLRPNCFEREPNEEFESFARFWSEKLEDNFTVDVVYLC